MVYGPTITPTTGQKLIYYICIYKHLAKKINKFYIALMKPKKI